MIYTVTLNPSIDYHVWIETMTEGAIHQAQKEWKAAGGKGINVSKVLHNLGSASVALGFVGGFTGSFIRQQLEQEGIKHRFIPISEDSRVNIKIKAERETDLSGVSPHIPKEALKQLLDQLDQLERNDFLVLAGSVPESLPADIYRLIMQRMNEIGVHVILDAKGTALGNALAEKPFLIKPNHHELGDLFGVSVTTPEDAVLYGRRALEMGASNAIVSMAGDGAVFVNRTTALLAQFPRQQLVNSIGAGDSMVAGFLYAYTRGQGEKEAFRYAVAAGSTTAISEGFCTPEKIQAFLPTISITEL
ncbi:1-phosphofructokinase [Brevibacillus choshinensis]|uniref:Tagatose-6-phosphate kinase n=1 Tax=Brevibacillus choshinensis TaxID=54911 RepID=A0ABX7FV57_BRECH|nr:1-phosphofructokinase [Brevibacillus choshinensis]QRG70082.1 1-phosphofructokinase [Brevibacillus choshinensis]